MRFCGYDTTRYKLFVWTFSAMLCGLAGALYVPQVGIINPSEMQPSNSIEMAIWVAVGGRGTPDRRRSLGAFIVNGAKSWLTVAFPSAWLYFLGALFILVTLFLPQGLVGLRALVRKRGQGTAVMTANPVPEAPKDEISTAASMPGKVVRKPTQEPAPASTASPTLHIRPPAVSGDPIADRHAAESILWVDDITVSFDGFKALTDLSLTLDKGELRCIIGPNGAGKTTLMDVITGKTRPDKGSVKLTADGTDLTKLSEYEIAQLGIGRKFQRPTVFQGHTVCENLELACKGPQGRLAQPVRPAERRRARQRIDEVLALVGLGEQARAAGRRCWPTATSSGWRSACCWCRTRRCCCWTSRWPA